MDTYTMIMVNIFLFILGSAMGSFLNVLSDRLPREESILGRSHCENCNHVLEWYDLFPIFSFLSIGGKCRYCKVKLSYFYPAVEVITGLMFILTWNFVPLNFIGLDLNVLYLVKVLYIVTISVLLVIFFADLKFQIIPDSMQFILLVLAILIRFYTGDFNGVLYAFIEGLLVMAPILLLYVLTKGKGMGFGDVKLAFVLGVLFGIKIGFVVLYISFMLGAIVGLILFFSRKKGMKSKIAFGPFIVVAMLVAIFFRTHLLEFLYRIWSI